ncbi:MAG TPA: hypothetical protein VLJ76_10110, partial [Gaiellaceae bacterium]|nr:hypothetical protein [Gaiellaceae bacterium]
MKKLALILIGAAAAMLFASGASHGSGQLVSPPNDTAPVWSPDGATIAYDGGGDYFAKTPDSVGLVSPAPPLDLRRIAPAAGGYIDAKIVFSPDSSQVAYESDRQVGYSALLSLAVASRDGTGQRDLIKDAVPLAWTSAGIVFSDPSGLGSIKPDGTGLRRFPAGVQGTPSPDASHFVSEQDAGDGSILTVVRADGGVILTRQSGDRIGPPIWSADGTRLAYAAGNTIVVAGLDGSKRVFPRIYQPPTLAAWSPAGDTLLYETTSLFALSLATGKSMRIGPNVESPAYSPDGRFIAYAAQGPCLGYGGRTGIYVMRADGSGVRRLTNSCAIVGTPADDTLTGSPYFNIIEGVAGNDTLRSGDIYFEGDTLEGGAGDDTLVGGPYRDTLVGGPGDDR